MLRITSLFLNFTAPLVRFVEEIITPTLGDLLSTQSGDLLFTQDDRGISITITQERYILTQANLAIETQDGNLLIL